MGVSLRESIELISDPRNLDASVEEVFRTMLGIECRRIEAGVAAGLSAGVGAYKPESVAAVIGFGGLFSGACVFRLSSTTALKIAGHMTGMEFAEIDDTVKDACGEICNMLAGAWKGRVPVLAGHCGLSVPAVITGRDYDIHVQAPEFKVHHYYAFEDVYFDVTILCDGLK